MVRDGLYYGIGFIVGGLVVAYFAPAWLSIPLFLLAGFCLWFFRDPERTSPEGDMAVSPADGKVVGVRTAPDGRETRISIFLNVFDVHVNRSPVAGKVLEVNYQRGLFLNAAHEDASAKNEMNTMVVETADGVRVVFKQIAGLIARRIECWKQVGDTVRTGERIGLMKFGSRMDILFGPEWTILVREGQRVSAGVTVIAERK